MENNKEKNFVSAVIYVHNAEERIEKFLSVVIDVLENNFENSEIICVNDDSSDNSIKIIKDISQNMKSITISILNMSYFHGLEIAMNAGVDLAIGDFVLEFDSTILDFDKGEIMKIYKKSLEGYDVVSASPNKKQKITSNLFYSIFDKFTDFSYKIYTERFRILSRRVINRIGSMNMSVPYRKAVYMNCGLKVANIKYEITNSEKCKSNSREKRYRKELAAESLILFTEVGYDFSVGMTMLMMMICIFMVVYSVIVYFMNIPVVGWTTTILFIAFSFLGLFGILTIIIKYLQILVNLVFKRKRYSFESIEKVTK